MIKHTDAIVYKKARKPNLKAKIKKRGDNVKKRKKTKLWFAKPKKIKRNKKTKKLVDELLLGSNKKTRTKKKNKTYDII